MAFIPKRILKYTCNFLRSMNVNNNCLQKSETKINQFYFLLLQIVLLTIVLLAAFGNDGIRLTFGRADFLGVGISVTLAITLPLTFIAYLCGGNLFVLVSFISVIIPFKHYHENYSLSPINQSFKCMLETDKKGTGWPLEGLYEQ